MSFMFTKLKLSINYKLLEKRDKRRARKKLEVSLAVRSQHLINEICIVKGVKGLISVGLILVIRIYALI